MMDGLWLWLSSFPNLKSKPNPAESQLTVRLLEPILPILN
jgi:hypothetical protein